MHPIAMLRAEHQLLLNLFTALESAVCLGFKADARVDLANFVSSIAHLSDEIHHAKEEELLFSAMQRCSFNHDLSEISNLLSEHVASRGQLQKLGALARLPEALSPEDLKIVRDVVQSFLFHMRAHVEREERGVLRLAENLLTAHECEELEKGIVLLERERARKELWDRAHELIQKYHP